MLNWVEIDSDAIRHNLQVFRRRIGEGTQLAAVVKSNAYGHGILEVAAISRGLADRLCVNSLDEALLLRNGGEQRPILVMGYTERIRLGEIAASGSAQVVYDADVLAELDRLGRTRSDPLPIHLKLETGTHRQGIDERLLPALLDQATRATGVRVEGVYTHFANIEDTTDHTFAERQIACFGRLTDQVEATLKRTVLKHAACSAASLLFTRTHLDMVRIGISLYGIWPSNETRVSCGELGKPALDLHPALTWKTRVAQCKTIADGDYVGYGCTWRATRPSRIAVLPLGYNEGYSRSLSGSAYVLIRGKRAPIRGRVCMNMCMADVTDIPGVQAEDEVVLVGSQGTERISPQHLAGWCGTIAYEIVTRIHPGLPRVVVQGDRRDEGSGTLEA